MNVSLYQAASALNANARWQEVISENLASSTLPGYRKRDVSFAAVQAGVIQAQQGMAPTAMTRAEMTTSFQPGEIRVTGVNTNVAIDGKGFFVTRLANGTEAYTRDGEFLVNAQGLLVNKQGLSVMGEGGPIQLDPRSAEPISISATGEVSQGAEVRGRLRLVDFNNPQLLRPISGSSFIADNPAVEVSEVTAPSVRQGCLECSNTSSVAEMGDLIRVMRSFEANQRVIQLQDERMSRAINELASPS